ncbi:MAG: Hsp20/alpha crystallin family protein [Parcubacteria group bacterium]|nr:Hsp20/alpha crystallin family protein [Parcubacteria group bacterium]
MKPSFGNDQNYFSLDRVLSWKDLAKQANGQIEDAPAYAELQLPDAVADTTDDYTVRPDHGQLALDIYQTAADLVVEAPIAGVNHEDLDISIQDDVLTIRGMRERSQDIDADDLIYQECHWGDFSRSIVLPVDVVSERVEATMKNGILTIRLPKALPNRRIQVRREE